MNPNKPSNFNSLGTMYFSSRNGVKDILDGTSNTLLVGEFSGLAKYQKTYNGQVCSTYPGQEITNIGWWGWREGTYGTGYISPTSPYIFIDATTNYSGYKYVGYTPNYWFPNVNWNTTCYDNRGPDTVALMGSYGPCDFASLKSQHAGGVHVLLADGSTRFISENIDLTTLMNLADKADRAVIGDY